MRATRRITALIGAVALGAGTLTAIASPASAVTPAAPDVWYSSGLNYGYEIDWSAPTPSTGVTSYVARLYTSTDGYTTAIQTKNVPLSAGDEDGDFEADFTGLTPGSIYKGTVAADYSGTPSAEAPGDIAQAYKPTGKVGSLKAKPSNHAVTATWKSPSTSALTGSVQAYFVEARTTPQGFGSFAIVPATKHTSTIKGLTNGRLYYVVVTPLAGDFGPEASVKARPIAPPKKPTKLTYTWKSHGKTKLSWKAPKSTTASPVVGYAIYVNGTKVKTIVGRSTTHYTVKGEKKGKKYSFSVRAYNAAGKSAAASTGKHKRPKK